MDKEIYNADKFEYMDTEEAASWLYTYYEERDFLYKQKNQLWRCIVKSNDKLKIKNLCTAYPKFIKSVNQGTNKKPSWHYLFKVYSIFTETEHEVLMSSKNLSSNLTFKRALINVPGVFFTGSKDDFDMFIRAVFNENSDYLSKVTSASS
ncbi:MAG: hypothetical protein ACXWFX_04425 [Methylobacter sp.]